MIIINIAILHRANHGAVAGAPGTPREAARPQELRPAPKRRDDITIIIINSNHLLLYCN